MSDDQKKERPDLGAAFIATNKKSPQSYDLSGTIVVDGVKHKFGTKIIHQGRINRGGQGGHGPPNNLEVQVLLSPNFLIES